MGHGLRKPPCQSSTSRTFSSASGPNICRVDGFFCKTSSTEIKRKKFYIYWTYPDIVIAVKIVTNTATSEPAIPPAKP